MDGSGIFILHLRQDRNGSVPVALELTRIKMPYLGNIFILPKKNMLPQGVCPFIIVL
jgi:hypothetical protein